MLFDTIFKANENSNQMILEGIQNLNASSGVKIDNISLEKISTLSLNEFSININKIKIYPNPAKNYIQIESNEISEFILFDSIGQEIDRHSNVNGNLKYDLSALQKGVYYFHFKISEKSRQKKITVIN